MKSRIAILLVLGGLSMVAAHANTITINSNGDAGLSNSGSTSCDTGGTVTIPGAGTLPECTLRAAIQAANNTAGSVDIEYATALECADLTQIRLDSLLPVITSSLHVHADTHPCAGSSGNYYPTIVPDEAFSLARGIRVQATDVVLEGFAFTGFTTAALEVTGSSNVFIDGIQAGFNTGRGVDIWNSSNVTLIDSDIGLNSTDNVLVENVDGFTLMDNSISGSGDAYGVRVIAGSTGAIGTITGQLPNRVCRGNTIANNELNGILVATGSQVSIRCNIIRGSGESGIVLQTDDNIIGSTTEPGDIVLPPAGGNTIHSNGEHGIFVTEDAEGTVIGYNTIGGTDSNPGQGNEGNGIRVEGGVTQIQNNSIAYNATGVLVTNQGRAVIRGNWVMNNAGAGIYSTRNWTRIGGEEEAEGNIIGLNGDGIWYEAPSGPAFPSMAGNYIGTNPDGDNLGNEGDGIVIRNPSVTTYIGQLSLSGTPRVPNVIGFNQRGMFIHHGDDVRISSNYIGTNADGDDLGNSSTGVVLAMTSNSRVGATATGPIQPPIQGFPNIIANSDIGVSISGAGTASINNPIRGNSFRGNGQAINLVGGGDEVDPGGGATGPNRLQNFPEIDAEETWYDAGSDTLHFRYRVQTNASNAAYPLRIDFYLADGTSPQGRTFVGTVTYESASANAWEVGTLQPASGVAMEGYLTATATDSDGNTSQFFPEPVNLDDDNGGPGPGPGDDEIFRDRFEQ